MVWCPVPSNMKHWATYREQRIIHINVTLELLFIIRHNCNDVWMHIWLVHQIHWIIGTFLLEKNLLLRNNSKRFIQKFKFTSEKMMSDFKTLQNCVRPVLKYLRICKNFVISAFLVGIDEKSINVFGTLEILSRIDGHFRRKASTSTLSNEIVKSYKTCWCEGRSIHIYDHRYKKKSEK